MYLEDTLSRAYLLPYENMTTAQDLKTVNMIENVEIAAGFIARIRQLAQADTQMHQLQPCASEAGRQGEFKSVRSNSSVRSKFIIRPQGLFITLWVKYGCWNRWPSQ